MTAPGTPLKVLFLTPPARAGGALAAQSFVDEEIRAIRDFNVRPYVLTDEISGRTMIDGIPTRRHSTRERGRCFWPHIPWRPTHVTGCAIVASLQERR
jgi:hypothetical protein